MKSQSGLEFVALFAVALAFFILLYSYLLYEKDRASREYGASEARALAQGFASLLTTAGVSNGFYYEFSLPPLVGGAEYNLTVANDSVWIDWAQGSFVGELRAEAVRNSTSSPPFRLGAGDYFVNNTGGTVWVMAR